MEEGRKRESKTDEVSLVESASTPPAFTTGAHGSNLSHDLSSGKSADLKRVKSHMLGMTALNSFHLCFVCFLIIHSLY